MPLSAGQRSETKASTMATITVTTNIEAFSQDLKARLNAALNPATAIRPALLLQIANMHRRIHIDGQASDGGQIGTYSKGYLAYRSGVFQNTPRISRGVNKGKPNTLKSAGTFTKGKNIGAPRTKFHRGSDPKVIISLSRQLENDYAVVPSENGKGYGISFHNQHNYDKSQFVTKTYDKPIFDMTSQEEKAVLDNVEENVNKSLNG